MTLSSPIYTVRVCLLHQIVEKDDEGNIIALEYVKKRVALHKAKYIKECITMKEMENTEDNQKKVDSIPILEEEIEKLGRLSEVPTVRSTLARMLRQYLLCYNWTQLHFLYVCDRLIELINSR